MKSGVYTGGQKESRNGNGADFTQGTGRKEELGEWGAVVAGKVERKGSGKIRKSSVHC